MKNIKKSPIFSSVALILITVSGWTFCMEDSNNNNNELQQIQESQSPVKKKKKKKKNKKQTLNLKVEFNYSEDNKEAFLEELNKFANGLLLQHTFIPVVKDYAINGLKEAELEVQLRNQSFVEGIYCSNGLVYAQLDIEKPEVLNIVLKNPEIFWPINEQPVLSSNKNKLELAKKLIANSDEGIKEFGNYLILTSSLKLINKKNEESSKKMDDFLIYIINNYSYLDVYIDKKNIKTILQYLFVPKGIVNEVMNSCLKGKNISIQEELKHMKRDAKLALEYFERKHNLNQQYIDVINEIKKIINEETNKNKKIELFKYLKIRKKDVYFENLPISLLPQETVQIKPEADEEVQEQTIMANNNNKPKKNKTSKSPKNRLKKNTGNKNVVCSNNNNNTSKVQKEEIEDEQEKMLLVPSRVEADDGSSVLEETEDYIKIADPKNNIAIKLFKTSESNQAKNIPAINYTEWVNAWFINPQKALQTQGYIGLENKKLTDPAKYRQRIILHSFAKAVDLFIKEWAKRASIDSRRKKGKKDILLTLPGVIFYDAQNNNNNESVFEMGLFVYIIDSENHQWYHRNFTSRSGKELLEEYMEKGFYEVEFPPLY